MPFHLNNSVLVRMCVQKPTGELTYCAISMCGISEIRSQSCWILPSRWIWARVFMIWLPHWGGGLVSTTITEPHEAASEFQLRMGLTRGADTDKSSGRNFPGTIVALVHQPIVRVANDQHGSPTYAPHLASALARLLDIMAYGTYHLAGQG